MCNPREVSAVVSLLLQLRPFCEDFIGAAVAVDHNLRTLGVPNVGALIDHAMAELSQNGTRAMWDDR